MLSVAVITDMAFITDIDPFQEHPFKEVVVAARDWAASERSLGLGRRVRCEFISRRPERASLILIRPH